MLVTLSAVAMSAGGFLRCVPLGRMAISGRGLSNGEDGGGGCVFCPLGGYGVDCFFSAWDIRHVFRGGVVSVFVGWLGSFWGCRLKGV